MLEYSKRMKEYSNDLSLQKLRASISSSAPFWFVCCEYPLESYLFFFVMLLYLFLKFLFSFIRFFISFSHSPANFLNSGGICWTFKQGFDTFHEAFKRDTLVLCCCNWYYTKIPSR
ncbi:hypothetical protein V8G54_008458 [Vigna mungo]|uniref:Uncharacterized protein n=1 Tax=Vigna mungo TaxID=3915 RepID=A0AAQ3S9X4_VIGMU